MGSYLCKDKLGHLKKPLVEETEFKQSKYIKSTESIPIMSTQIISFVDSSPILPSGPRNISVLEMCRLPRERIPYKQSPPRMSIIEQLEREVKKNPDVYIPMMRSPSTENLIGQRLSPPMENLVYEMAPQVLYIDRSQRQIVCKTYLQRKVGNPKPIYMEILPRIDERREVQFLDVWYPNMSGLQPDPEPTPLNSIGIFDDDLDQDFPGDLEDNWQSDWMFQGRTLTRDEANQRFKEYKTYLEEQKVYSYEIPFCEYLNEVFKVPQSLKKNTSYENIEGLEDGLSSDEEY